MSKYTNLTDGKWVVDISTGEDGYNYYGFINKVGGWAIMRENTAQTEYRFAFGSNGYTTAWAGRTDLNYKRTLEG